MDEIRIVIHSSFIALSRAWGGLERGVEVRRTAPDWRIQRAQEFLRAHYASDVPLEALAQAASIPVFDLCRRFSATYGLSPNRYQLVLRVHEAKSRLSRGAAISDVAIDLGFADQSHLGRHFKGRGAVPAFIRDSRRLLQPLRFDIHGVLTNDGRAVVLGELSSLVIASGGTVETAFALVLTISNGKIAHFRMLEDSFAVSLAARTQAH